MGYVRVWSGMIDIKGRDIFSSSELIDWCSMKSGQKNGCDTLPWLNVKHQKIIEI